VNHRDAVARKMDVELDPVRAGGDPAVESGNGVLGCQRGATAMGKNKGPVLVEESHRE
jgi:hypothetical protein